MNHIEKQKQLRSLIEQTLTPLINANYVLLDVPYYFNVGDVLIWEGTREWLKKLPYKCLCTASKETFDFRELSSEVVILLSGGGNFGDLYPQHNEFREKVISSYPENPIIILPQTIWFEDVHAIPECASALAKHKKLIICARDRHSYDILKSNFQNEILLVPDMAFCINMKRWRKPIVGRGDLLLKREDKELKGYPQIDDLIAQGDVTICDWLPFTEDCWQKTWWRRTKKYVPSLYDWYARNIFRPYMVNSGIHLIGTHKKIYSTRLHAAILSILLGKENNLVWFDNSYGKNSSFYETWLNDLEGLTFVE